MKTLILKILQFLHLSAKKPNPAPVSPPALPQEAPGPVFHTGYPTVILGKIDATADEEKAIRDGVILLNHVMTKQSFKDKVLAAQFTETNGLSNAQIYQKLCDNPITIDVNVYSGSYIANHFNHTVGYETVPGIVNVNRYFVSTPYEFADNIIHEAMGHSQGFSHFTVKETSVPYTLNRIFEAVCKELKLYDIAG